MTTEHRTKVETTHAPEGAESGSQDSTEMEVMEIQGFTVPEGLGLDPLEPADLQHGPAEPGNHVQCSPGSAWRGQEVTPEDAEQAAKAVKIEVVEPDLCSE